MHSRSIKDKRLRKHFSLKEVSKITLKFLNTNTRIPIKVRWSLMYYNLTKISNMSCLTRSKNFCVFSFRSRAVLRIFRCSRVVFRKKINDFSVFGFIKASW